MSSSCAKRSNLMTAALGWCGMLQVQGPETWELVSPSWAGGWEDDVMKFTKHSTRLSELRFETTHVLEFAWHWNP